MATKKTGISRDLIIHPGETIADLLADRNISQAELAIQTGVTPAYICKVISGKKDISSKFAMRLEYAFGISRSFWLNLQAEYDAEISKYEEEFTITSEEKQAIASLKEVIEYFISKKLITASRDVADTILELRKILQISDISNLKLLVPFGEYRLVKDEAVDMYVLGAWIRICQLNDVSTDEFPSFDAKQKSQLINDLNYLRNTKPQNINAALETTFKKYGIIYSLTKSFKGAPVQGYIVKRRDNTYSLTLTEKNYTSDEFWFTLFHEIGHIALDHLSRNHKLVDMINSNEEFITFEELADDFAKNALGWKK